MDKGCHQPFIETDFNLFAALPWVQVEARSGRTKYSKETLISVFHDAEYHIITADMRHTKMTTIQTSAEKKNLTCTVQGVQAATGKQEKRKMVGCWAEN